MASALSVLLIAGIFAALVNAEQGSSIASQQVAAFGRCRELLEQMRGAAYAHVQATNYPPESLTLTHLGGSLRIPILCTRSNSVAVLSSPEGKFITATVIWSFRGEQMQRSAYAAIYKKE